MPDIDDEILKNAWHLGVLAFIHLRRKKMLVGKSEEDLDRIENELVELNTSIAEANIDKLKNIT